MLVRRCGKGNPPGRRSSALVLFATGSQDPAAFAATWTEDLAV
jgi:hypothetical protein